MGGARIREILGVVENLAVRVLLGTNFIYKFVKGIFPPEHTILLYSSAPTAFIATVIKMEKDNEQEEQQGQQDQVKEATVVENKDETTGLVRVERQRKITPCQRA